VLQDVAGQAQVERAVRDRQVEARGAQEALGDAPPGAQLADVRVDAGVLGAGAAEGVGEVAGPAADVDDA
jgi:hypothetical protein